jgi:hypothetical protein
MVEMGRLVELGWYGMPGICLCRGIALGHKDHPLYLSKTATIGWRSVTRSQLALCEPVRAAIAEDTTRRRDVTSVGSPPLINAPLVSHCFSVLLMTDESFHRYIAGNVNSVCGMKLVV